MVILASFLKRDKQRFLVKDNQTNTEEAAAAAAGANANHDDGVDDFQREFSCHVHTRQSKA